MSKFRARCCGLALLGALAGCGQWAAVASQGRAIEVPGLAALNVGGIAGVVSVSCAPGGSCAAGGDYAGRHHHGRVFVVSENNGVWGAAFQVPGLGALSRGARVMSVSCGPAGTCAAGWRAPC